MRAIVTGGLGFVGSHIVDRLVEMGATVLVIDNLSTGTQKNENTEAKYIIKDLLKIENEIEDFSPDWVFHLAALSRIQPSFDDPLLHDDSNVRTSIHLLSKLEKTNCKALVYSSSSSCYGNPNEFPTTESAQISPLSPYALQKYTSERYLHILAEKAKLPVTSLRYFNIYGPRSFNISNPYNAYSSVVGIFQNQKNTSKPLTVTGSGAQKRDFIHVKDVVSANIHVAENIHLTNGNCYNVGTGKAISILELAQYFDHPLKFIPNRYGEAEITWACIDKIKKIGWAPVFSLKETILNGEA